MTGLDLSGVMYAPVRTRTFLVILVLQLFMIPASSGSWFPKNDSTGSGHIAGHHRESLQYMLDAGVTRGLPSVSLHVKTPAYEFSVVSGVANIMTGERLTADHAMYTASLGKPFTAGIALQLCDQGRLDLDVPVNRWLPGKMAERIPGSGQVTLRHLLGHTSGLVDYMNDLDAWRRDFAGDPGRQWHHSDILPYLAGTRLLFEPGTDFHYSNSNYILAGLIIEQVTGTPVHEHIRKRILEPVGMKNTFNGLERASNGRHARGYVRRQGRILDTYPWYSHYGLADSGLHSTPADLALFIDALFNSEVILSPAMQQAMTRVSGSGHPRSDYGLGIYVQQNPWGWGYRWYSHDGIDPGYQADMMYIPGLDLTIVLMANASMGRAGAVYERLIRDVVDAVLMYTVKGRPR